MPKNSPPAYELSDAEKRDLTQLIQQGKPLPEKYRFILFADKREVELVWNGKTRDVCTTVLPFQTLEHVDEPRKETKAIEDMFDARGRQTQGWTNKLIWGDNKLILSSLKAGALRHQIEDAGGLKLIYIDPPFDVGADFSMDIEIGGETFHKEPNLLEQIAYRDTWGRGADSFISMIYERLILMRDLLAEDGSIFLHCDYRTTGAIRCAMDEVFGRDRLINEICWWYKRWSAAASTFQRMHDTIFFYSKTGKYQFNQLYQPLATSTAEVHGDTRRINVLGDEGKLVTIRTNEPSRGVQMHDVWEIPFVVAHSQEQVGYPTQKPIELMGRMIDATTSPGDLVADFFCGSGTFLAAAEGMRVRKDGNRSVYSSTDSRKWIGSDLSKFAIHTTRKRLIGVQRELKAAEKSFRAFEVLNLGRYERQAYLNVGGRLSPDQREAALQAKEREFRELILRAYKAEALTNDAFFDGRLGPRLVLIGPINLPVGRLFIEEVITECRKRSATRCDVLAFEFEMGLFPAVLDEAKQKGLDLTPKYIPAEVFDRRAVDKGQVVFHDISFVEATPRYGKGKSAKDKLTLKIELTDFSVYYTQGAAEAAIANLKEGKNGVICEQGKLIKISKDKDGVVTREVLTKHWTDWVDYWAVDFDYQSRKEIIRVPIGYGEIGAETRVVIPAKPAPDSDPGAEIHPGEKVLDSRLRGSEENVEFEERWTGSYIFENEWQSFRTRKQRDLELITAEHSYDRPGRYTVAVKVIDIFGNDTMVLVPVNVG
ncbi:MAG: site-specific DNA-methyltransferase [Gammaproteobacteria bacterium]|nr:site-specific DNA-methyltransferase [Gammaproteobacteria bacterium]